MSDQRKFERLMNRYDQHHTLLLHLERYTHLFVSLLSSILSDYGTSSGSDASRSAGVFILPTGAQAPGSTTHPADWYPPADVIDIGDAYMAILELPGVQKNKVSVDLKDDGTLVVSGDLPAPAYYEKAARVYSGERW